MTSHNKTLSERYQEVNVKTAGPLKSWLMLLEKANQLLTSLEDGDGSAKIPMQNIFVQFQNSLNLGQDQGRKWHKTVAVMWDTIELGDETLYPKVRTLIGTMYSTLGELHST
jgi:flagellin-specific chaperone FliS